MAGIADKVDMLWKIQKHLDAGTSNPIVARIMIGLPEVIGFTTLPKPTKTALEENLHKIAEFLILAEKAATPLLTEINATLAEIQKNGVQTQSDGRCVNLPHTSSLENSRIFLKYGKQTLSVIADNFSILLNKSYKGPHFHRIREDCASLFGLEDNLSKLIAEDEPWIKQLVTLRDEDEHPKSKKPFFTDFDVHQAEAGRYDVVLPVFYDGSAMNKVVEVFKYNLLTFTEEATVLALEKHLFPGVDIVEIPEEKRAPDMPKRYTFQMKLK